jgi:hypothetical protein
LSAVYHKPLDPATVWRIIRVRLWEKGHTFEKIDAMSLNDIGDILAYWNEVRMIENSRRSAKAGRSQKSKSKK